MARERQCAPHELGRLLVEGQRRFTREVGEAAAREVAEQTLRQARDLCPVDTGALRASGKVTTDERGHVVLEFGGPSAPYAAEVERGKSGGPAPSRFVYRAVLRVARGMPRIVRGEATK